MKELYVFLVSASPLVELRGAIPLALGLFKFSWPKALFLTIAGNLMPIIPLWWFLDNLVEKIQLSSPKAKSFFTWFFNRTRDKFQSKWSKFGKIALALFVAIPLPFTGAWTATVAAFLFGIGKKEAFLWISLGVVMAGILVTALTLGGIKIFT